MPYSSSLTDEEWAILEPLLLAADFTDEEADTNCQLDKARDPGWGTLPTQEWLQLGRLALHTCPPTQRSIGTCIQWRVAGVFEELMSVLLRTCA